MPNINVKFKNHNLLVLNIIDSPFGKKYFSLIKDNYQTSFPLFRDTNKYTKDYMLKLAEEAKDKLGWQWESDKYELSLTRMLHKDLEATLGVTGFKTIPQEFDNLIHELHYCLHLIQSGQNNKKKNGWLQIEWYNDNGFPLKDTDLFVSKLNFGDVKLQNPFVGHGPLQIYLEQDFTNVSQTCKFHDFVKPGINILISNHTYTDPELVLTAFKKYAPEFVEKHTEEKIVAYTGHPVIGKVENIKDLHLIVHSGMLELEYLSFDE